jgi:hypothetical protein
MKIDFAGAAALVVPPAAWKFASGNEIRFLEL